MKVGQDIQEELSDLITKGRSQHNLDKRRFKRCILHYQRNGSVKTHIIQPGEVLVNLEIAIDLLGAEMIIIPNQTSYQHQLIEIQTELRKIYKSIAGLKYDPDAQYKKFAKPIKKNPYYKNTNGRMGLVEMYQD
jgi:hypothetical protein